MDRSETQDRAAFPMIAKEEFVRGDIEIRRVVKNEVVDGPQGTRVVGDTIIVPVVKEVLRVEKEWVLVEEIHVTKKPSPHVATRGSALPRRRKGILGTEIPTFLDPPPPEPEEVEVPGPEFKLIK